MIGRILIEALRFDFPAMLGLVCLPANACVELPPFARPRFLPPSVPEIMAHVLWSTLATGFLGALILPGRVLALIPPDLELPCVPQAVPGRVLGMDFGLAAMDGIGWRWRRCLVAVVVEVTIVLMTRLFQGIGVFSLGVGLVVITVPCSSCRLPLWESRFGPTTAVAT